MTHGSGEGLDQIWCFLLAFELNIVMRWISDAVRKLFIILNDNIIYFIVVIFENYHDYIWFK